MMETWTDDKKWERIRGFVPKGYLWRAQWAKRSRNKRSRKGRAIGGLAMGIRKELIDKEEEVEIEEEGLIIGNVRRGKERWKIIGVYVNRNIEDVLRKLEKWMERKEEEFRVIIGGDFNARTGREGGRLGELEDEHRSEARKSRNSKDRKMNKERKKLVEMIEERGWSIFNGNITGDEEGEFTFTGGK